MKLNNHGWGLGTMILLMTILIIFFIIAIYFIYIFYNNFEMPEVKGPDVIVVRRLG